MVAVLDELLIHRVGLDTVRAVAAGQQGDEVVLELRGEVRDVTPGVLTDDEHLPEVGFGLGVALEAVFVAALLLADLAVPSQPLKSLGLHLVGDVLRGADCDSVLAHARGMNGVNVPSARGILDRVLGSEKGEDRW